MKYIFNFENRERPIQFNREKLLLAALQEPEQLYYMLGTQYEGIYQAEALQRRRMYGGNRLQQLVEQSDCKFMEKRRPAIRQALVLLEQQKVSVFRRGNPFYTDIDAESLVPGDVVFLSPGDIIPADLRIVFSRQFEVNQCIYTGHSHSVPKLSTYAGGPLRPAFLTDLPNICFAGSAVVSGLARGVILSTGSATYLGHLLRM